MKNIKFKDKVYQVRIDEKEILISSVEELTRCSREAFVNWGTAVLKAQENLKFCINNKQRSSNPIQLVYKEFDKHIIQIKYGNDLLIYCFDDEMDWISIHEFYELCKNLVTVLNFVFNIKGFDVSDYDYRFLSGETYLILNTSCINNGKVKLSELRVWDYDGICTIDKCERLKALKKEFDIDLRQKRESNHPGERNSERLNYVLEYMLSHHYPSECGWISIIKDKKIILDGWHRAVCLYYLYGDIEIDVKEFSVNASVIDKAYFPVEKVSRGQKIILYGAGVNGKNYYRQAYENYFIQAWCDSNYYNIKSCYGIDIIKPEEAIKKEYDYIVVSIIDKIIQEEIMDGLVKMGVQEKCIIFP